MAEKSMTKQEYLYDLFAPHVPKIPQPVIDRRVKMLKWVLEDLLAVPMDERDQVRIKDVQDGIEFWLHINDY